MPFKRHFITYSLGFVWLYLMFALMQTPAYGARQLRPLQSSKPPVLHDLSPTFDPTHPVNLYAGSGNMLTVSHDGGVNWTAISTSGLNDGSSSALAIDPTQPSHLYLGQRSYTLCCAYFGDVFKSTDSGATWTKADQGLQGQGITALAVTPISPTLLYAGVYTGYNPIQGRGVYKSTDAGTSWSVSSSGLPQDVWVQTLTVDPHNAKLVYAVTDQGVYISPDSGTTWSLASQQVSATTVYSLKVDPQQSLNLYAATDQGVFISNDGGTTWTLRPASAALGVVYDLAFDPTTVSRLYAATSKGVFISKDAGVTWSRNRWVSYIPLLRH